MTSAAAPRIAVIGLGSVIQGDDGAGAAALAVLEAEWEFPPGVELMDLGTPGPYLAEQLRPYDVAVLVDTVRVTAEPGSVWRFDRDALLSARITGPRVSPHDPGVAEAIRQLAMEDLHPDVILLGIVPLTNAAGTELSEPVRTGLAALVSSVLEELATRGSTPTRRAAPVTVDLWWSRSGLPAISSSP